MKLIGKNVVVYGAGASGIAAYELARERGAKAVIYDDSPSAKGATSSKSVFSCADIIVLSPGVNPDKDFIADAKFEGKPVISEIELASSFCNAEQIAITGTNGKTTTTMLTNAILTRAGYHSYAVGNIGTPFSSVADKLDDSDIAVIEVSSFQLEGCKKFSPDIAVLLNIAPDHLERHGNLENYIAAKAMIFKGQGEQDILIYNDDDDIVRKMVEDAPARKIPFSLKRPLMSGAYISSGFFCFDGVPVMPVEDSDMRGDELQNVLAAIAICMSKGISAYTVSSAISEFERPKYRRRVCAVKSGISFVNDSKATNISACLSACRCQDTDTLLIVGGAKREENYIELFSNLPQNIKVVCACGENAKSVVKCAKTCGYENIFEFGDLKTTINASYKIAKEAGLKSILFSPAAKSFDSYSNYEERGAHFSALAAELSD